MDSTSFLASFIDANCTKAKPLIAPLGFFGNRQDRMDPKLDKKSHRCFFFKLFGKFFSIRFATLAESFLELSCLYLDDGLLFLRSSLFHFYEFYPLEKFLEYCGSLVEMY